MARFKTYQHPYTKVILTNSNCKFVCVYTGSDSSGLGTRESPYATLTKVQAVSWSNKDVLINGISTENSISALNILGDNNQSGFIGIFYLGSGYSYTAYNCVLDNLTMPGNIHSGIGLFGNKIKLATGNANQRMELCYIDEFRIRNCAGIPTSNTVRIAKNYAAAKEVLKSFIFIESVDLYNFTSRSNVTYYPIFRYCLFRKLTQWLWNGSTISINWNTNPLNSTEYTDEPLIDRVYNSLLYYANTIANATDKAYALAILATKETMFYEDANGQTNKVVDDVLYPIFNKYNGTTPIDYSLKLAANNVALTMSDIGGYVGAYKANLNHVQFGTILHVNTDGSDDTVTTPDLLISEGLNQFSASDTSLQLRNRIRTIVSEFQRGKVFDGSQSMLTSGIASRLYFGKYQPMVTTGANSTIPVETIEVIPYDAIPADNSVAQANNLSEKSAFPRFSIMFNGAAEMWYKNNVPLLFSQLGSLYTGNGTISNTAGSDTVTGVNTLFTTYLVPGDLITVGGQTVKVLSIASATSLTVDTPITNANTNAAYTVGIYVDKSLTEYGDWAVTNADIEDYSLSFKTAVAGVSKRNIPVRFCKLELNLNYAEE